MAERVAEREIPQGEDAGNTPGRAFCGPSGRVNVPERVDTEEDRKGGKKGPIRHRTGLKKLRHSHDSNSSVPSAKIVPFPRKNNRDPNCSDRDFNFYARKEQTAIRQRRKRDDVVGEGGGIIGPNPGSVRGEDRTMRSGKDSRERTNGKGRSGRNRRRRDNREGPSAIQPGQSLRSAHRSAGVSNSSVACEIPASCSSALSSCLMRSCDARSVTTTWAVRAFSVVLRAQT